ncbi:MULTISPECIES: hypothetical protein [Streptomycetaceae]|nr:MULTISPECIES: hypothetical protein [Streptomycetaceae]MYS58686.1 hypothetical protein [Streptomyces sp. SID5468]CCB74361.1 protein of unknown function [Streptantibioticus cattleyicolor NRRL 8057 = DSM 46488]
MSKYVDDFLAARAADGTPIDGPAVLQMLVDAYREAVDLGQGATATAYGKLLLRIADQQFGEHPEAGEWLSP